MNNLKDIRVRKILLQKEVAAFLGVSTAAYGRYENGLRDPSLDMLRSLGDYFGVTVDEILGRETSEEQTVCQGRPIEIRYQPKPVADVTRIPIVGSVRCGWEHKGFHGFRRCFALERKRNGDDIFTIQRALGHSSPTVTMRYIAATSDDDKEAAVRSSPMDRRKRKKQA